MSVSYFNEMFEAGAVRPPYARLEDWTRAMPPEFRAMKQAEAEALFRRIGITFAVYGEGGDPDRLIPFDMFPRVFTQGEWRKLDRGIKQRARALNAFLVDVYGRGEIVRAGRIPQHLVYGNEAYTKRRSRGSHPPRASTAISSASTSCARGLRISSCLKTIAARHRASATCWKTARS